MNILVACEFSGIVRNAFAATGHNAWSCDLLPTEQPGNHIQDNVLNHLNDNWDMMIAHPPCTYLSYAGMGVWNKPGRAVLREAAMSFFRSLFGAPIKKICIENPRGYPFTAFRSPDQIIQPYFFGEYEMKTTCLWLKNLPCLSHFEQPNFFNIKPSHVTKPKPKSFGPQGKAEYFTTTVGGGKNRQKNRCRFWPGIASAMAEQWGKEPIL